MHLAAWKLAIACALWMVAEGQLASAADDPFLVAAKHYSGRDWSAACDAFGHLLASEPKHPRASEAYFFYGEALAQLGRFAQARTQFAALLEQEPQHRYARQALFRSGEAAFLARDDRAARRDLAAFLAEYEADDLNAYVLAYLGSLALEDEDYAAAERHYAQALSRFPQGPLADECRLGRAEACEHTGDRDAARREYGKLLASHSRLADQALLHLGSLENSAGEYAAALELFEQLGARYANSPLRARGRLGRSFALCKLGRFAEAEELLPELQEHPKLNVEARYWLGIAQVGQQKWAAAADTLLEAGRLDTAHALNPGIACLAGESLLQTGRTAEARREFMRVLDHWPDSAWGDDAQAGLVELLLMQREHAECIQQAEQFAQQRAESPLWPRVEQALGQAQFATGQNEAATKTLEHCLNDLAKSKDPADRVRHFAGLTTLALCYAKQERTTAAARIIDALRAAGAPADTVNAAAQQVAEAAYATGDLRTARDAFGGISTDSNGQPTADALSGLAWSHFKAGDWAAASTACEQLLQQHPQSPAAPEAAVLRGRALEHLERPDPALAMYHLVVNRYGGSPRAAEALWRAGNLHEQLDQKVDALTQYERLVAGHPSFSDLDAALYRGALLRQELKSAETADAFYAQLIRDFPKSRYAHDATLRLAQRAFDQERFNDALELLRPLADGAAPLEVRQQAWLLEGRVALARRDFDAAENSLQRIVHSDPNCELVPAANYLLAETSYQQGKYLLATERFTQLVSDRRTKSQPWLAAAELRRAQAFAQLKDWEQALDVAQSIAGRFPDFSEQHEVDYLIGRAWAAQAEFALAREAYERVTNSASGRDTQTAAMARWMIGETYFHQENYTSALAEYGKVDPERRFPRWQAAAMMQGGKCYEMLGRWRQAAETYDLLVKSFPAGEFADEALRRSAAAHEREARASRN